MRFRFYSRWLRRWKLLFGSRPSSPPKRLALLIDADNASSESIGGVVCVLEGRFDVYYRRAYSANFNSRMEYLGHYGIKPIKTFPSIQGRAATDIAITVDAMEEMPRTDALCIIACDGDFSGLLQKFRERGKYVIVAGQAHATSAALRTVCNEFLQIGELTAGTTVPQPIPRLLETSPSVSRNKGPVPEDGAIVKLAHDLTATYHLLRSDSIRPTLRALEAKHRTLHPNFRVKNYKIEAGNPPAHRKACNFVELLRSMRVFKLSRVPNTRAAEADYYLEIR